jgi:curved DNA-binding protein CbpA
MDPRHYFNLLELPPDASLHDVKQAYKDLVSVWHPDRFTHNPRLKEKAENKLKDINAAYEILKSQLHAQSEGRGHPHAKDADSQKAGGEGNRQKRILDSKTELAVELGAYAVLTVCYSVYKALHHVVSDVIGKREQEDDGRVSNQ